MLNVQSTLHSQIQSLKNSDSFRQSCSKYYQTSNLKDLLKQKHQTGEHPEFSKKEKKKKSDQINLFTEIWPNIIKFCKTLYPKTHTKDKTNLNFLALNDSQWLIYC